MTNNNVVLWTVLLLLAVVVVVVAAVGARRRARFRTVELRRRFGPEYDRTVERLGSTARAERDLSARARRVEHLRFQELTDADRARFESTWTRIQAQFVDDPAGAVTGANQLIKEVMHARGYPEDGFERRVADLSVSHPEVVEHYRAARALSEARHRNEPVATEELRQAVVHYRVLFADLLEERGSVVPPPVEVETARGRIEPPPDASHPHS